MAAVVGGATVEIPDLYSGTTSRIYTGAGITASVPIRSGINQGCPLSGLLFDFSIDTVIRDAQSNLLEHRVLAFADDLCIIADTLENSRNV